MTPVRARSDARRRALALGAAIAAGAAIISALSDSSDAAATQVVARYEFEEAAASNVLIDSSGNGLNGRIGDDVEHPVSVSGATGHRFEHVVPINPPQPNVLRPQHLNVVPDNPILDPGNEDFAITVRVRKTASWGNLLQKGQNTVAGGYFKIEMPVDYVTCVFKDGNGVTGSVSSPSLAAGAPNGISMRDGNWHVVRCEKTKNEVKMWVDGREVGKTGRTIGSISNSWPLVFGGKYDCDHEGVSCDYFSGDIDYMILEKGNGVTPTTTTSSTTTSTSTTSTTSTTTTTIVAQLPPGFLEDVVDGATGGRSAERLDIAVGPDRNATTNETAPATP